MPRRRPRLQGAARRLPGSLDARSQKRRNEGFRKGVLLVVRRPLHVNYAQGRHVYAIVYKSDGFPICRQIEGISPDPVVTWNTEAAAKAFIASKGGDADFQPVQLTDEAMDKMAGAMGCPVESITFDPYPG
jgi:hypothetical protein